MVKVFHWPSGEVEHKVVRQFGFGDCTVVLRLYGGCFSLFTSLPNLHSKP